MKRAKHILSYSIPILVLLFFLFGSFFAPNDPTAANIRDKFLSSSTEYPFGTDDLAVVNFLVFWREERLPWESFSLVQPL